MTISLRARLWRIVLKLAFKGQNLSIEQNRARGAQMGGMTRIPKDVDVERFSIDGIPAAWVRPETGSRQRVVLHFHGGGYVTGGIDSHLMMAIPMAQTLKTNVLLPEYRLSPEHPHPAALEDALKTYRWLLAEGYSAENIVISGDSAGGGLSLATVLSLRDNGDPLPGAVVCISPWADLTHHGQSHSSRAESDVILKTSTLKEWALCYTDASNLSNPLVSPVFGDFRGFPRLLIQVGSDEILLDDSVMVAEKARAAGVDITLRIWKGLWHVWPALGDMIPETRLAFNEIKTFLEAK